MLHFTIKITVVITERRETESMRKSREIGDREKKKREEGGEREEKERERERR